MSHDLFSSLDSFAAVPSASSSLLVRDVAGEYRPAEADEVLAAAQRVLASRVRGTNVLSRAILGTCSCLHLHTK